MFAFLPKGKRTIYGLTQDQKSSSTMATHDAVATIGLKQPLGIVRVPTVVPTGDEVRVRVEWTASTPLDLHQNDGGLLVTHPQVLGDGTAGTVVEVGPDVKRLTVGDQVFGFTWRNPQEKAHQEFCTTNEWLFAKVQLHQRIPCERPADEDTEKLPEGFKLQEAVTLPNNFVTVFHSITADLGIETPWPKPADYQPRDHDQLILIWGGASSVGMYALQILRYFGYTSLIAVASRKHHEKLRSLGAKWTFDYNDSNVVAEITNAAATTGSNAGIPKILDCIASQQGSLKLISKIAKSGSKVAALLPVIVRDSSETEDPIYAMDVDKAAEWEEGVQAVGVRTHFYLDVSDTCC